MPEPYRPKKKGSFTLADAEKNARLARIRCYYCKTERHFLLRDLRTLFGNIEVDDVIYRQRWRCTNCNSDGTLDLNGKTDAVGPLTITGGQILLPTGSVLTLGGTVTATSSSTNAARITGVGQLALGTTGTEPLDHVQDTQPSLIHASPQGTVLPANRPGPYPAWAQATRPRHPSRRDCTNGPFSCRDCGNGPAAERDVLPRKTGKGGEMSTTAGRTQSLEDGGIHLSYVPSSTSGYARRHGDESGDWIDSQDLDDN